MSMNCATGLPASEIGRRQVGHIRWHEVFPAACSLPVGDLKLRYSSRHVREENAELRLENTRLKVENQLLRNEIARLKSLPPRPPFRPGDLIAKDAVAKMNAGSLLIVPA